MVDHTALSNYIDNIQKIHELSKGDKVLLKTPFYFDVSVRELIWTLCFGGTLVISEPEGHKDPIYISNILSEHQINIVHFVPSMLEVFLHHPDTKLPNSLIYVICSGESLQPSQAQEFYRQTSNCRLLNMYGPTEATVEVTSFNCEDLKAHKIIPIGKEIDNTNILILNNDLSLCDSGSAGEIYIGGDSLSVGYFGNEELTQKNFVDFVDENKITKKLYKTGDLARYLRDGNIEFLGRMDDQINIRGYRIELGEITSVIASHINVKKTYVTTKKANNQYDQIIAYVVVKNKTSSVENRIDLFDYINKRLPEYMTPHSITFVNELALTPNGKIDKNSLPEPQLIFSDNFIRANNDIEKSVSKLWKKNLNINEDISIDDGYFKLGGDSISVIHLVIDINKKFHTCILLQDIISLQTIYEQSALIMSRLSKQSEFPPLLKSKDVNKDFEVIEL